MANTTISPNMGLPVPVVGVDPGTDWAVNLNACYSIIDGHNHSPGNGVQITPDGINISSDLSMNDNNLTIIRTTRYAPQAVLTAPADLDCVYVSGVDLYYNDGNGNNIRITQSGSVSGASGTITGLPSGTASASYSGGTFTFQSATSTPASLNVGPLIVGNATANSKTITIAPAAGISNNYNFILPVAPPGSSTLIGMDSSGNILISGTINNPGSIAGGTLTENTIIDAAISSSVIDGSPIGSVTPSTGEFTTVSASTGAFSTIATSPLGSFSELIANETLQVTAAGPIFKMEQFNGILNGTFNITLSISGIVLGAIGVSQYNATTTHVVMCQYNASIPSIGFNTNGGSTSTVEIANASSLANSYSVTVFYV